MLIRSQDKMQLMPLEAGSISIEYKDKEGNKRIYFYDSGSTTPTSTLGLYSTKEKAMKVLDMICDAYESCERTDYQNIGYVGNAVFQMPQDSEVEA